MQESIPTGFPEIRKHPSHSELSAKIPYHTGEKSLVTPILRIPEVKSNPNYQTLTEKGKREKKKNSLHSIRDKTHAATAKS